MGRSKLGDRKRVVLATTLAIAVAGSMSVTAQAQERMAPQPSVAARLFRFNIAAQPLPRALNEIGRTTGLAVIFTGNRPFNVTGRPVQGNFTPSQALAALLAGTGVTYRFTNPRTVTIDTGEQGGSVRGGSLPAGAIALDTIDVQGAGNPNSTMSLPPAYAGGQVARGGQLGILGNRDMMDTPFNQTSYTSKLLQDQQSKHVSEVLKNDPSVIVPFSSSTGLDYFTVRGFGVNGGDILYNGMIGIGPTESNSMLSESVERVDVIKGPAAMLTGITPFGSVGGTINIIPKRANDTPITQFTADYSMTTQVGGHADVGRRFGKNNEFGVRFNGVYRNGDTPIDRQSRESALATFAFDYRGERFRISSDIGYQYNDLQGTRRAVSVLAGVLLPKAPENSSNFFNPWEFATSRNIYSSNRAELDLTDSVTAFGAVGLHRQWITGIRSNPTITNSNGDLSAGNAIIAATQYTYITTEAGIRSAFETGPVSHKATVAYTHTNYDSRNNPWTTFAIPASNIYTPTFGSAPSTSLIPNPHNLPKTNERTFSSAIIGDTLSILDERAQLTAGVRFQKFDSIGLDAITGAITSDKKEKAATPMLGLLVKPWNSVSLYANYIEGLQPGPIAPPGTVNAGEVFDPYLTKQYEIGAKWDLGRITSTLSAYQIALPVGVINPSSNVFGIIGRQRHRGLEFNTFGEVADDLRLLGGVAYIDSELSGTAGGLNDGNNGIGAPKYHVVLGSEWDTSFLKGLTLTGRVTYTSGAYLNAANSTRTSSWTQIDLGARYTIERSDGNPIIVRANIVNALDSNFWTPASTGQIVLSDPLTFRLSTTFRF